MFGKQMIALQTRKQALLLESDLNRLRLNAEMNNLREITNFSKRLGPLGRLGGWGWILAAVAGVATTFGLGRTVLGGAVLRKALTAAPALIRLWRTFSEMLAQFR
jgi:hypothetical protein